jgi:hypothetical protein
MTLLETVNLGGSSYYANAVYIDFQSLSPSVYYPITYSYFLLTLTSITTPYPTVYVVVYPENFLLIFRPKRPLVMALTVGVLSIRKIQLIPSY